MSFIEWPKIDSAIWTMRHHTRISGSAIDLLKQIESAARALSMPMADTLTEKWKE